MVDVDSTGVNNIDEKTLKKHREMVEKLDWVYGLDGDKCKYNVKISRKFVTYCTTPTCSRVIIIIFFYS